MHDIKFIRQNPDAFDAAMARRGLNPIAGDILKLDEDKRAAQTQLQELQTKRNQLAKAIGQAKGKGEDAAVLMEEAKGVNEAYDTLDAELKDGGELKTILETLPNIMADAVPEGKTEDDNKELRKQGELPQFSFTPKQHFELGEQLGQMDFETAAKISGSRFVILSGALARLERGLASFFLDHNVQAGFTETVPPLLVRDSAMYGTGQLPKFAEDAFKTTNDYWLISTSEISLTNIVAGEMLEESYLPRRYTAYTPCFRSEAGSAGKDTRGMIRQHQFSKVEMVSIVKPEESEAEHEMMVQNAEGILQKLGLPYRVMLLCAGDTGFGATKTYDIEVWLPGQNAYREVSSISNCHAFQARRMNARYKTADKKKDFVHTLNGSGLPIGRTMVALLENYQQEDGSIVIPEALRPYMGGLEKIEV